MKKSLNKKHKVLVLDGDHKNALAIVRHLGRTKLYEIDVASSFKASVAFYSKYTHEKFVVANPHRDPEKYINDIIEIIKQTCYLTVIPVSYISFQLFAGNKEKIIRYSHFVVASPEQIDIASSKIKTYRLAEKTGIPYPKIIEFDHVDDVENAEMSYPCVIKAPLEVGKNLVDYAHSKKELISKYRKMCASAHFDETLPIVQKYIQGDGAGFFAFYKNGKCQNYFMHRRIREYPVTGGASVVAEAYYDEQILKDGKKLLDALAWEGIAMVEFKKDNNTGIFNLIEINAKFWGSLDLALVCGANFPQAIINDALRKDTANWDYTQKRFQWILNGDVFHMLERPWKIFLFFRDLFVSKNDFWIRDIGPNLYQIAYIPVHYYKKWFK